MNDSIRLKNLIFFLFPYLNNKVKPKCVLIQYLKYIIWNAGVGMSKWTKYLLWHPDDLSMDCQDPKQK